MHHGPTDGAATLPETRLVVSHDVDGPLVRVGGDLTLDTLPRVWRLAATLDAQTGSRIDVSDVPRCDTAGAALLLDLRTRLGGDARIVGASEQVGAILAVLDRPCAPPEFPAKQPSGGMIDTLGEFALEVIANTRDTVEYVGALSQGLCGLLLHPGRLRWRDCVGYMSRVGADALGIVALVSALMGLILAFQMASQMQQYGADLYVADIVALSVTRELGPLMTAILVAGRSGSAFAAEIGTMKVNEEIAALDALGLDRIRFLALPKIVALLLTMPFLVVFADLCGLSGGLVVGNLFLDLPVGVYVRQTFERLESWDLLQGLVKGECYAIVIAAVGCLRGLQTREGAQGVGISATSAVVSAILLVIVTNAILTAIFHHVG